MNIRIFTPVHNIHDNYRIDIQENQQYFCVYRAQFLRLPGAAFRIRSVVD